MIHRGITIDDIEVLRENLLQKILKSYQNTEKYEEEEIK